MRYGRVIPERQSNTEPSFQRSHSTCGEDHIDSAHSFYRILIFVHNRRPWPPSPFPHSVLLPPPSPLLVKTTQFLTMTLATAWPSASASNSWYPGLTTLPRLLQSPLSTKSSRTSRLLSLIFPSHLQFLIPETISTMYMSRFTGLFPIPRPDILETYRSLLDGTDGLHAIWRPGLGLDRTRRIVFGADNEAHARDMQYALSNWLNNNAASFQSTYVSHPAGQWRITYDLLDRDAVSRFEANPQTHKSRVYSLLTPPGRYYV